MYLSAGKVNEQNSSGSRNSVAKQAFPQVLDCSVRDGGYLNNWDFPIGLVQDHVSLLNNLGVDKIEIGLRRSAGAQPRFAGLFSYSPPHVVNYLKQFSPHSRLGVMVNSSEYGSVKELESAFKTDAAHEDLSFIRIATRIDGAVRAGLMAEALLEMGFEVYVNLMQVSTLSKDEMSSVLTGVIPQEVAAIYLADSFGSLVPAQVQELSKWARELTPTPVGFHFHDNLGLAFANSLAALSAGASFVDGTVLGIGRGAGNTKLESLLLTLGGGDSASAIAETVSRWKSWQESEPNLTPFGESVDYGLAALGNVHPSYVQLMIESEDYSAQERIKVIEELSKSTATVFEEPRLEVGSDWFSPLPSKTDSRFELFRGQKLLLLGGGQSIDRYKDELLNLIERDKPLVIQVGQNKWLHSPHYEVHSHPLTILSRPELLETGHTKIGPFEQIRNFANLEFIPENEINVELLLSSEKFGFDGNTVSTPSTRSSIFALALLSGLGLNDISLAGFDGYPNGDSRNEVFSECLRELSRSCPVASLTPTLFDLNSVGF